VLDLLVLVSCRCLGYSNVISQHWLFVSACCLNFPAHKRQFYTRNYEELKLLNPSFPLLLRTTENAMPAVTTELEWTINDVLRFMIQTGRFRDPNGTLAENRIEAAKAYLATDWDTLEKLRWKSPGFDPDRPLLEEEEPNWLTTQRQADLAPYLTMKQAVKEQEATFRSGPPDEYTRAENALLMCQRVDLWCAGPLEVERAVQHLYKLGRARNEREVDFPSFITQFVPGADDIEDS
jgi:hypothetical protein